MRSSIEKYQRLIKNTAKHWENIEKYQLQEYKESLGKQTKKPVKIESELIENFSQNQEEIIRYDQSQMLVKGVAGSGKTLTLVYNAIEKSKENSGVYFFTFNKTLKKYITNIFDAEDVKNIHVTNFHAWALEVIKDIYKDNLKIKVLGNKYKQKKIRIKLLKQSIKYAEKNFSGRFITDESYHDFLIGEFDYINNQHIQNLEEYLSLSRVGRGVDVRLSQEDRKEIYQIYDYYHAEKSKRGFIEFSEFASILLRNIEKLHLNLNHIFIDEAQDFNKAQLLLLRTLAKETFYLAADKGQKIYETNYSWKDLGINIRGGRTKILNRSYRTTREVLRLAQCLQSKDSILEDEDYTEAQIDEMKGGSKPDLILYKKNEYKEKFIRILKEKSVDNQIVGVLVDEWREIRPLEKYLNNLGIHHERIQEDKGTSLMPGVKFTSMHSSKGLEFDHVIIADFSYEKKILKEDEDDLNRRRRLYYVSFTRARDTLTIFVPEDSPSIFYSELDQNLYNVRKNIN